MKTKLVIVERDGKGNIIIDENEFKDFISRVYDEGFEEGKASVCTTLKISEEPSVFTTEYDIVKTCNAIDDMLADIRNGSQ